MANITLILGTDSVSSSRPIINSNFELLNDALAAVTALLNPSTLSLSGLVNVSTKALAVGDAAAPALYLNTVGGEFKVPVTLSNTVKIGSSLQKSGVAGTKAEPSSQDQPSVIDKTTYFSSLNFKLPVATDGQEVTIINVSTESKQILVGSGASLAATTIALDGLNSTVTLRCFNNEWYVIASHNTTVI
jgi:hypothetical protein